MCLSLLLLDPQQHFTRPPPRYTDAKLIRALEERGIGRPSTYASIMQLLQVRPRHGGGGHGREGGGGVDHGAEWWWFR